MIAAAPKPSARDEEDSKPLRLLIAPFAKPQNGRAWWQLSSTFGMFLLGWAATAWAVAHQWGVLPALLIAEIGRAHV